jgi:hypothetical protein
VGGVRPVDFWTVGVACVDAGGGVRVAFDGRRWISSWYRVGVAGAFGGEVVGGGWRRKVGG